MALVNIPIQDTLNFSKVWTYHGLAIPLKQEHLQFANDYANVALNQFIVQCNQQAAARAEAEKKAIEEANKPKIVL